MLPMIAAPGVPLPALPALRTHVLTFDRQLVDTTEAVWRVRVSQDGGRLQRLRWASLEQAATPVGITPRSVAIAQRYCAWKLTTSKASTVANAFAAIARLLRWYAERSSGPGPFDWAVLEESLLRAFLAHGLTTGEKGNDFSRLRDLYLWGAFGLQLPDFDPQLALLLRQIRAPGNLKGAAVRHHDPRTGPLDGDEQRLLRASLLAEAGGERDRAIVMLHYELGLNPHASVRLRNADLRGYAASLATRGGSVRTEVEYHLEVPRVKKRTERRETRARPLSPRLGALLTRLQEGGPQARLLHWLPVDNPERSVYRTLREWSRKSGLISPRTGERLVLSPRRLRYTLATELAREGASRQKIAEVLDHTDLQNVEVYIEASSYLAQQIGSRMDAVYAPLVRRFRGQVVERDAPQPFAGIARKVVPGRVTHLPPLILDVGGIGACGRDLPREGICRLAPPLSCYTCAQFAAFREAPHAEIAQALERIVESRFQGEADLRIPRQLEETLQAIRQLEAQITREARGEG
jgi:integrase